MDRKRSFVMAGSTVLLALGAGQYMQSGTAESSAAMIPVPQVAPAAALLPAAATPLTAYEPKPEPQIVPVTLADETPAPVTEAPPEPTPQADLCAVTLDAFSAADAMLSISFSAPCHPNQTVVLHHAGLSVTYQTTAIGALFVDVPALEPSGALSIRLPDGIETRAAAPVPEVASLRRLAVQWMAGDNFILTGDGNQLALGTYSGPAPMLAQVVTLPADAKAPFGIESEITNETCGRELLGEVLYSEAGTVTRADLSLSMPECDGIGGFVTLNNPVPDMKLAATE
jgi:hypothetical protein